MSEPLLFSAYQMGPVRLRNRIIMAPLTRSRADAEHNPTELMAQYYGQRASAGLIVSEGIIVSPQGAAYPRVPGLFTERHVQKWTDITDAVHQRGGKIFAQLWHVGRQSHSTVQPDGKPPWAPSAVAIDGYTYYRKPTRLPYETPRVLSQEGIDAVKEDFRKAALAAIQAGFDGVELHGANGYLIDQFLNSSSNRRTDRYGGSIENRARFLQELVDTVGESVGFDRVAVRVSPSSTWMDAEDDDKLALHTYVAKMLSGKNLAYLHVVEPGIAGSQSADVSASAIPSSVLRPHFSGTLVATGGLTLHTASRKVEEGVTDLVGFGRLFIANPDLPERLQQGASLLEPDKTGFYAGGAEGYTSYPFLHEQVHGAELNIR